GVDLVEAPPPAGRGIARERARPGAEDRDGVLRSPVPERAEQRRDRPAPIVIPERHPPLPCRDALHAVQRAAVDEEVKPPGRVERHAIHAEEAPAGGDRPSLLAGVERAGEQDRAVPRPKRSGRREKPKHSMAGTTSISSKPTGRAASPPTINPAVSAPATTGSATSRTTCARPPPRAPGASRHASTR